MDVVFLDANILFSAAYREDAGIGRLWELPVVDLVTSDYALEEARRNLEGAERTARLDHLAGSVRVVATVLDRPLPVGISLPDKDRPILLAAIHVRATHLLTGDVRHFGPWYGRTVEGVRILPPATYLRGRGS